MLKALVANDKGLFRPQRIKEGETDVQYNAFVKKQDHEFQELRFLLAVTFFHELHHGFVAYLAGNTTVFTPTTASYMASASDEAEGLGESGSFAERNVLGGVVIMDPPPSSNQVMLIHLPSLSKYSLVNTEEPPDRNPSDHNRGKSLPNWIRLSQDYQDRPSQYVGILSRFGD